MIVITEPRFRVASVALEGKTRDTLCLTWEERRWTRKRVVTTAGREVGLALPTGSLLRPGDIVAVEIDWYLEIEGKPEPVLAVTPRERDEAIRIAFDVGNRHFPLATAAPICSCPTTRPWSSSLTRLGVAWSAPRRDLRSVSGAAILRSTGGARSDGHSHVQVLTITND